LKIWQTWQIWTHVAKFDIFSDLGKFVKLFINLSKLTDLSNLDKFVNFDKFIEFDNFVKFDKFYQIFQNLSEFDTTIKFWQSCIIRTIFPKFDKFVELCDKIVRFWPGWQTSQNLTNVWNFGEFVKSWWICQNWDKFVELWEIF